MTNGGRGRSEPTAERSARSGSVAGRGYRYQDGVAGYVAVLAVTGELPVDDIYCEGLEDVNFHIGGSAVRTGQVPTARPGAPVAAWTWPPMSPHFCGATGTS